MHEHTLPARGLAVFGTLRAEEEPWLADCFVPPAEFEGMIAARSIVVFGAPGGGKSALCRMLAARTFSGTSPSYLVVHWRPTPYLWDPVTGFDSVPGQVIHVFDLCALEVLRFLAHDPDRWAAAPEWARWMLAWFVGRFLRGDPKIRVAELLEESPGREVIAAILAPGRDEDLLPPNDWRLVTAEFAKALQRLGLQGIWVMVDGLETWLEESGRLLPAFVSFLSTLPLFEEEAFAYKVFAPEAFFQPLLEAEGVDRRRFMMYRLTWSEAQLVQIVERRLALATGKPKFPLKALCSASPFLTWLRRAGGESPRVWLECVRPFVARYLETGRPVPASEWNKLRERVVPRVILDEVNRLVIVGGRRIPMGEIPSGALRILQYLYRNAGRVVPWDELYYKGYRGKAHIPGRRDPDYEEDYENTLYSRLSDLRRIIEPEPESPICIETVREEGVRLRVSWG